MITAKEYNTVLDNYDTALNPIERKMKEMEKGNKNEMGLLKAEVKNDPKYQVLKDQFNLLFDRRKKFCQLVPNKVKREASNLRRQEKINRI